MRRDDLDELRLENPVPETPAPPPVERLLERLDQEPLPDSRPPEPARRPRWQRVRLGGPLVASVGVTGAIAIGAFVLLRTAGNPRTRDQDTWHHDPTPGRHPRGAATPTNPG
jgi:hypothetical protein